MQFTKGQEDPNLSEEFEIQAKVSLLDPGQEIMKKRRRRNIYKCISSVPA